MKRWCLLLLFAWCLHLGCLLWWFFFFLWRSCWCSLQNSTSSPFLQDSRLAVSGCASAASTSSLLWWSTMAFLWSYTSYCLIFYVATGSQSSLSAALYENCSVSSGHLLTQPSFHSCTTTISTSVLYCRILVLSFVFQLFFQIVSFFARTIVVNSFPVWVSSWPEFYYISPFLFVLFWSSSNSGIFSVLFVH